MLVEEDKGRINGDGRRLDLGGEHTIQYTGNLLQNYTPKTYLILLTNVTQINSIKESKIDFTSFVLNFFIVFYSSWF